MLLTPEQVQKRAWECHEKGLCFISLKPIRDQKVSAQTHRDFPHSLPILVLKEYVKS